MSSTFFNTAFLTALCISPLLWADGMPDTDTTDSNGNTAQSMTNADRKAKSEMFDNTAKCLRSNKSEAQCEKELNENCHRMGGMKNCGMGMM